MVTNLISRLGAAGLILIASLVIFAFLAGGVVVHRLETSPTAAGQHEEKQGDRAEGDKGQSKTKHSNHGHGASKSSDSADDTEND